MHKYGWSEPRVHDLHITIIQNISHLCIKG